MKYWEMKKITLTHINQAFEQYYQLRNGFYNF